jgi:SSS family solute:Na+ symporter
MAQHFWTAIWACVVCGLVTVTVSLVTRPREERELVGLVYSLTPKRESQDLPLWRRPATLGVAVIVMVVILNLVFA